MQQTPNYQLNLIEKTDIFSPDALNENTQKVEDALLAHEGTVRGDIAAEAQAREALAERVTALELNHVVVGKYIGNNVNENWQEIHLGFAPAALLLGQPAGGMNLMTLDTKNRDFQARGVFEFTEYGFRVRSTTNQDLNHNNGCYVFIAFS